tara:strand:- start:2487 stop:3206 length:720 start_codon:yes stop_codon:yes gene_type:complete
MVTSNGEIHSSGSWDLVNEGTLIKRGPATANWLNSGTLRNTGTVLSEGGTWTMNSIYWQFDANTYSGASLLEGAWVVSNGTFNFPTDQSDIDTIGASASVILKGSSSSINKIGNTLATVNGTIGTHLQQVFSTTTGLAIPGTFEVGLGDPDTNSATVVTGIDITGGAAPNFTSCSVDVVDTGLTNGGTFTIMTWAGADSGTPAIGTTPNNGLVYQLVLNDLNLQLNIFTPPKGLVLLLE